MGREEALAWTKINYLHTWHSCFPSPEGWTWLWDEVVAEPYLFRKDMARIYRAHWEWRSKKEKTKNALDVQVGGGHYKDLAIQPVEYCMKNNLSYCQSNIVKYATRYKDKNGLEDLKKIKHYVDLIIELEYGDEESINNK